MADSGFAGNEVRRIETLTRSGMMPPNPGRQAAGKGSDGVMEYRVSGTPTIQHPNTPFVGGLRPLPESGRLDSRRRRLQFRLS